jgi:hypothetical protein
MNHNIKKINRYHHFETFHKSCEQLHFLHVTNKLFVKLTIIK